MIKDNQIYKGDVYYAVLNPAIGSEQKGERPVVVIQNDYGNKYSPTIIIAPLTKILKKTKLPTHIFIPKNEFLIFNSMVLLEQTRVIDKSRLQNYLGRLDDYQIQQLDNALIDTFDMNIIGYLKGLGLGGERYERQKKILYRNYYYRKK